MSFKRMPAIAMASALGALLSAPLAVADTPLTRTVTQEQIADQLESFERDASDMRTDLDRYASTLRTPSSSLQLHAYNLNDAKEQVNSLGLQLTALEELSPHGTEIQQAAIREARPHLEAVADHVQTAILLYNDNQRNARLPDFREKVNGMYEHANNLYVEVDTITDGERDLS